MKFSFSPALKFINSAGKQCFLILSATLFTTQVFGTENTSDNALLTPVLAAQLRHQCANSAESVNHLIAKYQIIKNAMSKNKLGDSLQLTLVRNKNEVAHQYPQTGITESWQLNHADQIKSIRFFDKHERAIEYQPNERVHGKTESDWSYRNQLISDSLLNKFTTTEISNEGCNRIEKKTYTNHEITMDLTWFSELRIVNTFTIKDTLSGSILESWSLQSVQLRSDQILDFFKSRHSYFSTDFADIGDDHTDPFLTNMMNLGFIEKGASGFYDIQGNPMMDKKDHSH
jgi:hypothetical protein